MKFNYKCILISFWASVFFHAASIAQIAPSLEWQNAIGGNKHELATSIIQTNDGGYILGGFAFSGMTGDKTENNIDISLSTNDYWIIKMDALGNIEWQNTIGGTNYDYLYSIEQTSDGGYFCGGYSKSGISGDKTENCYGEHDYWIVKLDGSGNIEWQKTIGGDNTDYLRSAHQTADGGYILGGFSHSNISGNKTENCNGGSDYWVIKVDPVGNIQWQNTIGGNHWDNLFDIKQTFDGGYILGGISYSDLSIDKTENNWDSTQVTCDFWVIKLDATGSILWQNTIGGNDYDELYSISQTTDGGYICGGRSYSNISGDKTEGNLDPTGNTGDYWVIKLDALGNILWQNTIGGTDWEVLYSIFETTNGNYICAGQSISNISGDKTENNLGFSDIWILGLDSIGNIRWQNTVGGNSTDYTFSISQTSDGGFICGGGSYSNSSGDKTENNWDPTLLSCDYWVIKFAPDSTTGLMDSPNVIANGYTLFPNPVTTQSILAFKNSNSDLYFFKLFDLTGREIERSSTHGNSFILTNESKMPGVYLFDIFNEKTKVRLNGKIIISN